MKRTLATCCLLAASLAAEASVLSTRTFLRGYKPEISDADLDLTQAVSIELYIDFTGQLGAQQLFLSLDSGEILYHPLGGSGPPSEAFISLVPSLAGHTFVTAGGKTAETSTDVLVVGGAVSIPGASSQLTMSPTQLSIAWAPAPGNAILDQTRFLVARLTVSKDASGTIQYLGTTLGSGDGFISTLAHPGFRKIQGDFTLDDRVDGDDLNVLISGWGKNAFETGIGTPQDHGIPTDVVDNAWLNLLLETWGDGTTLDDPAVVPTPEPTAGALVAIGLLVAGAAFRRSA